MFIQGNLQDTEDRFWSCLGLGDWQLKGMEFLLEVMENVLKLTVVMMVCICDYAKNLGIVSFKWVNCVVFEIAE